MAQADAMIAAGHIKTALICTAALTSRIVRETINLINNNPDDYLRDRLGTLTCGDAGAAMITTGKKEGSGLKSLTKVSVGGWEKHCYYKYENGKLEGQMLMQGMTQAIDELHSSMISNTYHYLDWSPENVDYLFCHQVGKKTHQSLSEISGVPIEKMPEIFTEHGKITTCSIPLAMSNTALKKSDNVLIIGGGSGFSSFQGGMAW